jgi:hypothetical protein
VARCRTFSAVHRGVVCRAVTGVHTSERERCSRRAERALAGAVHGLERGPRAARAVAGYWLCRRWPEGADGEAATAGLPPKPLSPLACARSASARERERVRCRWFGGWRVGSWGSSWAEAHRRLGVWRGEGEREGVGQSLQDCLGLPSFFVSKHKRTKARGRKWREGRERGKG